MEFEEIMLDGKKITILKELPKEDYEDYIAKDLEKTQDLSYLKEVIDKKNE